MLKSPKIIVISTQSQELTCFDADKPLYVHPISTGKNGVGERINSECTPRGWHKIHSIIGLQHEVNSVWVSRKWTGEIYSEDLGKNAPDRDWILTRILQLEGLEPGRNLGGEVDSLNRYIYIHGTPDSTQLGIPGSRGCIRMKNNAIIQLALWANTETLVYIQ